MGEGRKEEQGQKTSILLSDEHGTLTTTYNVKDTVALSKVFDNFCNRNGFQRTDVRFYFEGTRINDNDTIQKLGIKDKDTIDVVRNQIGGA
ncbi:Sentrin [Giardia muris]|uniref:Sentrin n=1 Tax=Giardia muris TaxID=5742 RepID=A0A4Z1SRX3_GIAMU|nr:Sentrin [Giardia muris]|eukprot:TNJ27735.1 Sentrin [Giardia muris]